MINITQNDFNIITQKYYNRYIKINLLDFQYHTVDEISGEMLSCSISVDADSDLRRSCTISLVVNDSSFNIQAGGKIWIDKYIQIYIGLENIYTNEIQWYSQGIYLINAPEWSYNSSNNILSFTGLDLMSKLTGLRNGQLEGVPTVISQGESVRNAIISTLELGGFSQYIVSECTNRDGTIQNVPVDIEIDQGGTVYDILAALRDILPNYQIYFDIDGVFHYELIPTGVDEPVYLTDDVFNKILIEETINTDFESVKNYIEVYGRTHDIDNYSTNTVVSNNNISLTISSVTSLSDNLMIGFTTPEEGTISGNLTITLNGLGTNNLVDSNGNFITSLENNVYYVALYQEDSTDWLFLGHLQAQAIVQEDNPDSPFYVNGTTGIIRIVLYGGDYDNIQSDELALERGKFELYQRARLNDNLTLNIIPIPWLDVNIVISHTPANSTKSQFYLIKSFSVDYSVNGTMSINAITMYDYYPPI